MKDEKLLKKAKQYKLGAKFMMIILIIHVIIVVKGQFFDNKDMSLGIVVMFLIFFQILIIDYIGDKLEYLVNNKKDEQSKDV